MGGWIVPAQAVPSKQRTPHFWQGPPLPPDRSLPHAHLATGMALRAFASHPAYKARPEVIAAAESLKSRFFLADKYNDRKAPSYWFKFQFPFWWSNLLTALDTLSRLDYRRSDAQIERGLDWFRTHQGQQGAPLYGLWAHGYGTGPHVQEQLAWTGLAVCRVFKRLMAD